MHTKNKQKAHYWVHLALLLHTLKADQLGWSLGSDTWKKIDHPSHSSRLFLGVFYSGMGPREVFYNVSSCLDDHIINRSWAQHSCHVQKMLLASCILAFWFIYIYEVLLSLRWRDCIGDVPLGGGSYHVTTSFLHLDVLWVPVAAFS